MDLTPFRNLIKDKCGLFFEAERLMTLETAIRERMAKIALESPAAYFNRLLYDQDEFLHLVNLLTVNETYFFRESVHLKILLEQIIPKWLELRSFDPLKTWPPLPGPVEGAGSEPGGGRKRYGPKIKILSAGCSTGEEPYSLVIALMEKYGTEIQDLFSIMAVDIDRDAIRTAKKGIYGNNSFRNFDEDLKKKYFKKVKDNRYQVADVVRGMVEFQNFNLLSDFYPETLLDIDVIFYRNVSIYFDPVTQKKVLQKLSQALKEKGYLFMSPTETFLHNVGILSLIEMGGIFLYHKNIVLDIDERRKRPPESTAGAFSKEPGTKGLKQGKSADLQPPTPPAPGPGSWPQEGPHRLQTSSASPIKEKAASIPPPGGESPVERRKDNRSVFDEALSLAKGKKYEEALNHVNKLIREEPSFAKAYTLKASILINLQQIEEAKKICLELLAKDPWVLEGFLLLGLIAKIQNDEEEAVKRFKEALYVQPSCWLAHFYLAEICFSQGEWERAQREYKVVVKLLEKGNLADHGLTFFPLSFSAAHVIQLCRHNLAKLEARLE